jgi:hypothetical protein
MGINNSFGKFLFYAKNQNVSFEKTLTLGRLKLYISKNQLQQELSKINSGFHLDSIDKDEYSERFFQLLGSKQTDSMDYSDYEKASIIHDLNKPIPENLKNQYSTVLDSGTLEHVFNFPVAIKNCLEAVKPGGHFIAITPSNNMLGHGFYQFSPELYFRILSIKNGFQTRLALLGVCDESGEIVKWYQVTDPHAVKQRVMLCNAHPAYLLILAQKTASVEIFKESPYQSDYVSAWESREAVKQEAERSLKQTVKSILPTSVSDKIARIIHKEKYRTAKNEYLGIYHPDHFREFNFTENLAAE